VAELFPRGSVESQFFGAIADAADARINWNSEDTERSFDGRRW
jgi:hypothetical protein